MKNYRGPGKSISVVAGGDVASGSVQKANALIGVAGTDAKAGDSYALHLVGIYTLPKGAGAINAGDKLYWTGTEVTKTADTNDLLGAAAETVASAAAEIDVRLTGGVL